MFRNPCHRCLVRPSCTQTCDIYEKFANRSCYAILIFSSILIPFYIFILYLLHKYFHYDISIFIFSIFIFWLSLAILFEYILKDKPDVKGPSPFILFLISPWLVNVVILSKLTRNYGKRAGQIVSQKLH